MNTRKIDYSLYLVTDTGLSRGRSHEAIVAAALRGGVTVVQYREKDACTRDMVQTARRLFELCRAYGAPFIVNDRLDVAQAVGADGVHVGQEDMSVPLARRLLGPNKIIGVTAHTVEEALQAIAEGADYIGASPVFATATKSDAGKPIGVDGLLGIVRASSVPVVGISGIGANNIAEVIRAGAAGAAVVSAIVAAEDVEGAANDLYRRLCDARFVAGISGRP